jgi:hypothetical protein
VCLSSKPGAWHESVAIRVRVLELWGDGLGGDAWFYPQGRSLMVSESRGMVSHPVASSGTCAGKWTVPLPKHT